MRRRSSREIAHRLRQEFRNAALWLRPPELPRGGEQAEAPFPDAGPVVEALGGTRLAAGMDAMAGRIVEHRVPLLGGELEAGGEIRWRRDAVRGVETEARYFRRIPYLDAARCGDHKVIWELNRHQHLVLLAQAWRLTGRPAYLREIEEQLASWHKANPFQCGINWTSALEVALRALSWMWIDHLAGTALTAPARRALKEGLYRHAWHLDANLSIYFSPNTHLLGEGVALHALGRMFRGAGAAAGWERRGREVVAAEMERQVLEDGSHFERSSYYHVYALDMFLFHATLAPPTDRYKSKLGRMAEYLEALMGGSRALPFIGDDDGGRFFHPFGERECFGRATLAAAGIFLSRPEWTGSVEDLQEVAWWWFGPRASGGAEARRGSAYFPDAGIASLVRGETHCLIRAGGFGPFRAGHTHADALSIVARHRGREILIDPGTYTYCDPQWRDAFRGTASHNTVRMDGLNQADAAGPFGWEHAPQVAVSECSAGGDADFLDASVRARGARHRRRVALASGVLFILDEVEGARRAEQFWHAGLPVAREGPKRFRIGQAATLLLGEEAECGDNGWRSRVYGSKEPAAWIRCEQRGRGALRFGAVLRFHGNDAEGSERAAQLTLSVHGDEVEMRVAGGWEAAALFPERGRPRLILP